MSHELNVNFWHQFQISPAISMAIFSFRIGKIAPFSINLSVSSEQFDDENSLTCTMRKVYSKTTIQLA